MDLKDVVTNSRGTYLVSTVLLPVVVRLFDGFSWTGPYETMVFPCDAEGNVTNWGGEEYCERYFSPEDAELGHEKTLNEWRSM